MLKIVGDINFTDGFFDTGFGVGSLIKSGLDPFKELDFRGGDLWIGNFECVCSSVSNKSGIYKKQFNIDPKVLATIKHLDIYNVANNHVMQHGENAYEEMLNNINSFGSSYFGGDCKRSHTFKHQDKKISISGFSQRPENFTSNSLYWSMPEYKDIEVEYSKIQNSDIKIAYIHWGNEFINYPYNDQRQFARWLIDLGYDLIVGMHQHVLQGYEIYNGKYIFYSLGNFVFNMPWYKTKFSAIISIDCTKTDISVSYDYVKIGVDYCPTIISSDNVPAKCRFDYLNTLISNIPENELYYRDVFANMKQYRKANYLELLKSVHKFRLNDISDIMCDFLKRRLK